MPKNNKRKSKFGWSKTKKYPHERHPANYVRKVGDKIEYLTFTHSPEVKLLNGAVIQTVPMADNISKKEREENKRKGLKRGENRSYAYPVVFVGKRSALYNEIVDEFEPIPFDKARIEKMFQIFPRVNVKYTGNGKSNKKAPK